MRKKLIAVILTFAMVLSPLSMFTLPANAAANKPDVLRSIFGNLDEVAPEEKALDLPYRDGTVLSDVREALGLTAADSFILGESAFASDDLELKSVNAFTLPAGTITLNGKRYPLNGDFKLLGAAEGDFNGNGKKSELALLVAAKTSNNRSLLFVCTASAAERDNTLLPVLVLYCGTTAFYNDTKRFANTMEIVCADVNGDGFDEIVTATPTSGFDTPSNDGYGFDRHGGAYLWSLNSENNASDAWKSADGWKQTPETFGVGLTVSYGDHCYLGAPGTTAALAAGDVDGDGYDDLVTAFSTTKAQYNANYASNQFSVYYIGGAPTVSDMMLKRSALMRFVGGTVRDELYLTASSGDAAGFDVAICDIDETGKPTIFLSFKQTVHHWSAMSGTKMFTPSYYLYSFDMKKDSLNFTASLIYRGGIYHHGWMAGGINDTLGYVYRTDTIDCAPVRIGVLKGDFGLSNGKTSYLSSGTIVADQRLLSFVRYPDGNAYRYEIANNGCYTGTWGMERDDNGQGFADDDCVFYRNGINVTDIKTANVRFDGTEYEDAALISAYTDDGYRVYALTPNGSRYDITEQFENDAAYAVIALPDTDNDSIHLKYNKHRFFWADPVILAALASPPYFDSLPNDMYTNSQTTYGKSLTSSTGKSETYTVSAGSYISTEIKAGGGGVSGVFEAESEAMRRSSSEQERVTEVTYSQSFSASGGGDTVVLSTVAYDAYAYTAYYPGENGTLASSPYIVYIPRGGSDAIKIASLTYEDYQSFCTYANGALPDLTDVFTHTVGKPETYLHTTPSGSHVLTGSVLSHNKLAGFPTDTSSQTQSIEITEETTETTSSGSSVSVKLGGGFEAEADDIFGLVNTGSKITVGQTTEKEYECAKIQTKAVGTSLEGTVFGQGDGMNTSGGQDERAYFNWRLVHYIYDSKDGSDSKQFPVVTYITSGVIQPSGVVPTSLSVTPAKMSVEQVGPKTVGYVNEVGFTASIAGVTREAYTALENAPLGMTLNTGGGNIGTSGSYPFGIRINSNVKPGTYELYLNVGGVRSNPFTVVVEEYTDPIWIEADKAEIDFGSMRYNYVGTPTVAAQTVTISNIHTEQIRNLAATLDENSDFEITEDLSANLLYAKDLANSSATVKVAPKRGLSLGKHTGTLKVSNGVTSAFVSLSYTVTEPTMPQAPSFQYYQTETPNPIRLQINAPEDDGGGQMLYYLYTLQGHENYVENGIQLWKKSYNTTQSGNSFTLFLPEELTIGESYTIGVKARTTVGESEAAWHTFTVSEEPGAPDPVKNIKLYPGDGSITVTWDAPDSWGENEFYPQIPSAEKNYKVYVVEKGNSTSKYYVNVGFDEEHEWKGIGLENGKEYEITVYSATLHRMTPSDVLTFTPSKTVIVAPSRPTAFKAYMSYKTAELSWNAPCYTGDEAVSYQVSKDGTNWVDVTAAADGTASYTFEGLTTNREYEFRVRSINSAGAGESASLTALAPSNLDAPTNYDVIRGYEQLEYVWDPSEDASVTGCEVKIDDGEWQAIDPILFDGKLHYIFTGLENERAYDIYVRFVNHEGGGKTLKCTRKPSSRAPLPPINPRVEPRNGGIQFYAEKHNPDDTLIYKVDNRYSWWYFDGETRLNGFENGKEYTVGIATSGKDEYGFEVKTTVYLTVTPDASIPDPPSEPIINAYIGEELVRIVWNVESDGGSPITAYQVSVNDGEPIRLPATENAMTVSRSEADEYGYIYVKVSAINAVGTTDREDSIHVSGVLEGRSNLLLASNRNDAYRAPYRLMDTGYVGVDDDGNPIKEIMDISNNATWTMTSDSDKITWDEENRCLAVDKSLSDGIYTATVTAEYQGVYHEKTVVVTVGATIKIRDVHYATDSLSIKLDLPEKAGEKLLFIALYDSSDRFVQSIFRKVSEETLSDGTITVALDTPKAATAKILLLDGTTSLQPLCESASVALTD